MSGSLHCTSPPVHFRAAAYYSHIHFITTFNFKAVGGNHVGTNKLRFWVTTGSPILIQYHLHVSSDLPKGKTQLNLFLVRAQAFDNSCCHGRPTRKCNIFTSVFDKQQQKCDSYLEYNYTLHYVVCYCMVLSYVVQRHSFISCSVESCLKVSHCIE